MEFMIQVDISNIWGEVALPDLLSVEKEISAAHMELAEGWMQLPVDRPTEEMLRIQAAAQKIRGNSDVFVVVGAGGGCLGAQAAMELLRGAGKGKPEILFTGDTLSTRAWQKLQKQLEGKDFSIALISKSGETAEPAIAGRALRWMLERKYGSENARKRIYAITGPEEGPLRQMAREAGWETFDIPAGVDGCCAVLTAAGLLPMAVAGLDIKEMMVGAWEASVEYDLRSFENPVWLYAGVRSLLHRRGKTVELLGSFEPDFRLLGNGWQRLFGEHGGLLPVTAEFPAALHGWQPQGNLLETILRFDPPQQKVGIVPDVKNLDGLNCLEGKTWDFVQEQAFFAAVEAHTDAGVPVISLDAGEICENTLGQMFWFFQLSCAISARILGGEPTEKTYQAALLRLLGKPGC